MIAMSFAGFDVVTEFATLNSDKVEFLCNSFQLLNVALFSHLRI